MITYGMCYLSKILPGGQLLLQMLLFANYGLHPQRASTISVCKLGDRALN